jgi:hypothetical protein
VPVALPDPVNCLPRRPTGRPAALAQSAERFTRNEQVVGSIPTGGSQCDQGVHPDSGDALSRLSCSSHGAP